MTKTKRRKRKKMPFLNYECKNGHQFEKESTLDKVRCPTCRSTSEILWMAPRSPHRQLQTPIVMWQYSDGSLGVAGGADSKTPRGAERLEIRSVGDYRRYAKQINSQLRSKEERKEEKFMEAKEAMEKQSRSNLSWLMGQESDPVARDLYREALESSRSNRPPSFGEYFSVAMEMDKSNYE